MYDFIDQIEVKSIPEQIADEFKKKIISRELEPGNKLPSLEELTKKLGVSKPSIREAFQILQELGLISTTKGRNGGYFVTEFYPEKLMDSLYEIISFSLSLNKLERSQLLEIRKMIEVPCSGFAAERRTEENLEALEKIKKQIDSTKEDDIKKLLELDLNFHLVIAESTQNPLTKTIINAITKSFLESNLKSYKSKNTITANMDKVIDAIAEQDAKAARHEMERHIEYFL